MRNLAKTACLSLLLLLVTMAYANEDRTEITETDEYRNIVVGKGPIIPEPSQQNIQIQTDDLLTLCREHRITREYCHLQQKNYRDPHRIYKDLDYVQDHKKHHPK